jgi:hypothetical protein
MMNGLLLLWLLLQLRHDCRGNVDRNDSARAAGPLARSIALRAPAQFHAESLGTVGFVIAAERDIRMTRCGGVDRRCRSMSPWRRGMGLLALVIRYFRPLLLGLRLGLLGDVMGTRHCGRW